MVKYGNIIFKAFNSSRKGKKMNAFLVQFRNNLRPDNKGMEMVQVAILIAIAVALGLVFKDKIGDFVNKVFRDLLSSDF